MPGQVGPSGNTSSSSSGSITINTTTITGGTAGRVLFEGAGNVVSEDADLTFSGDTLTATKTSTGNATITANGAASAPPITTTGTWFTGGSATTTKPQLLIEPTGTTSTGWSTAGTGIGVNAASGFTGKLLDLQLNGIAVFNVDSSGAVSGNSANLGGLLLLGSVITIPNPGGFIWASRSAVLSPADGNLLFVNNAINDFGRIQLGGTTSSFPSIKRSGADLQARLADDSADTNFYAANLGSALTCLSNDSTLATAAGTIYTSPGNDGTPLTITTESAVGWVVPRAGTITNLYVRTGSVAKVNTPATAIVVRKNGSDTALTVAAMTQTTATTSSDTTHSFTVAAGDVITVSLTTTGAAAVSTSIASISFLLK